MLWVNFSGLDGNQRVGQPWGVWGIVSRQRYSNVKLLKARLEIDWCKANWCKVFSKKLRAGVFVLRAEVGPLINWFIHTVWWISQLLWLLSLACPVLAYFSTFLYLYAFLFRFFAYMAHFFASHFLLKWLRRRRHIHNHWLGDRSVANHPSTVGAL